MVAYYCIYLEIKSPHAFVYEIDTIWKNVLVWKPRPIHDVFVNTWISIINIQFIMFCICLHFTELVTLIT